MLPLWAIGALAGVGKSELIDRPAYENKVKSRAIEARFAPLEGKATPTFADIKAPDTVQTAIDYGLAGAAFGKQFGLGSEKAMSAGLEGAKSGAVEGFKGTGEAANFGAGLEGAKSGAVGDTLNKSSLLDGIEKGNSIRKTPVNMPYSPDKANIDTSKFDYSLLDKKPVGNYPSSSEIDDYFKWKNSNAVFNGR